MAFLVCYSRYPPDDHTRDRAIYLDQRFYESIFEHCRSEGGPYTVLREIAGVIGRDEERGKDMWSTITQLVSRLEERTASAWKGNST